MELNHNYISVMFSVHELFQAVQIIHIEKCDEFGCLYLYMIKTSPPHTHTFLSACQNKH